VKILAFSPHDLSTPGGNLSTLRRIGRALAARGHAFELRAVRSADEARAAADAVKPDVLHFYHAWKTGRFLPALAPRPRVLTLAGTDVNEDWNDPALRPLIDAAIQAAGAVVTYSPAIAARVPRARVVPKGVHLGQAPYDLRRAAGIGPEAILFLQTGGIRPVKNNLLALRILHGTPDALRLVFLGPVLDAAYGRDLERAIAGNPRARHLPAIDPEAMASAYGAADVVLNTSLSEGLSNSLMEAMACGRAILASDVPGNRDLGGGLLYRTERELEEQAARLAASPELRRSLGESARARAAAFSVDREIDALLGAYEDAIRLA
jgi:L-malate glycosyltransferase